MSEEWMTERVEAGRKMAERMVEGLENPVHAAVELGTAAGAVAISILENHGSDYAASFLNAMVATFNQEARRADPDNTVLILISP